MASLQKVIIDEFSGHMENSLVLMVSRAIDRVKSDADGLENVMKGMGTKDQLLIHRLVQAHWNREHFRQVKVAYQRFHKHNLADRVRGETSGDYGKLMVALCG
jgi:annexin A7/11